MVPEVGRLGQWQGLRFTILAEAASGVTASRYPSDTRAFFGSRNLRMRRTAARIVA